MKEIRHDRSITVEGIRVPVRQLKVRKNPMDGRSRELVTFRNDQNLGGIMSEGRQVEAKFNEEMGREGVLEEAKYQKENGIS